MLKFILVAVLVVIVAGTVWLRTRRRTEPEFRSTQEMMEWMAAEAVKLARDLHGVWLDYTPESIEKAETVLANLHAEYKAGKLKQGLNGLAMAMGAYVGECIRRSEPGAKWEQDHPAAGPKSYPLHWRDGESFPCGWCYKRIVNGPEDNVWHKYVLLKQQRDSDARPTTAPAP